MCTSSKFSTPVSPLTGGLYGAGTLRFRTSSQSSPCSRDGLVLCGRLYERYKERAWKRGIRTPLELNGFQKVAKSASHIHEHKCEDNKSASSEQNEANEPPPERKGGGGAQSKRRAARPAAASGLWSRGAATKRARWGSTVKRRKIARKEGKWDQRTRPREDRHLRPR